MGRDGVVRIGSKIDRRVEIYREVRPTGRTLSEVIVDCSEGEV